MPMVIGGLFALGAQSAAITGALGGVLGTTAAVASTYLSVAAVGCSMRAAPRPAWRPAGTPAAVGPDGQPLPRRVCLWGIAAPVGAWSEPVAAALVGCTPLAAAMRVQAGAFADSQAWAATRLLLDHDWEQDVGGVADGRLGFWVEPDGLHFWALIDDTALIYDLCWLLPERLLSVSPLLVAEPEDRALNATPGGLVVRADCRRVGLVPELSIVQASGFAGIEESLWLQDADSGAVIVPPGNRAEMQRRMAAANRALERGWFDDPEHLDMARLGLQADELREAIARHCAAHA